MLRNNISDLTQYLVLKLSDLTKTQCFLVSLTTTDLASCTKISGLTKMTFSNLIQFNMIKMLDKTAFLKILLDFGTQKVIKNYFSNSM